MIFLLKNSSLQPPQRWFFLFHYGLFFALMGHALTGFWSKDPITQIYVLLTALSQSAWFLLPLVGVYAFSRWRVVQNLLGLRFSNLMVLVVGLLLVLLLYADRLIEHMFGFHLNGFVLNLLITPGGLGSLGGDDATTYTYLAMVLGFLALEMLVWLFSQNRDRAWPIRRSFLWGAVLFFVSCDLTGRLMFAFADIKAYSPVLTAAQRFPGYVPLTMRHFMSRWGVDVARSGAVLKSGEGPLHYPLAPLVVVPPQKPYNVLWLTVESWRQDMLDPEIMPKTFAFSQKSQRFLRHYSGGNGTRVGMFTQFYGLSGQYWFSFLNERRSPVIMDVLQQQNYQLELLTSARFSYPEFDKTIFVNVPAQHLHEGESEEAGWVRDHRHVDTLLHFWDTRDPARPFMNFMFFESPHARYHFPESAALRKDYLADFNYATMKTKDMPLIFNRYVNACHYLDEELSRVFTALETKGLLDSTVVILTGDHGEEFMEKGHWGHNSEFTQEQIRVPLVMWVPGRPPQVWNKMTSHLDIVPTLLPLLGVQNPAQDYALGIPLFSEERHDHILLADWSRLAYFDGTYKAVFPLQTTGGFQTIISDAQDRELPDPSVFYRDRQATLAQMTREIRRFQMTH